MFRSLKTLSECKQAFGILYMATVQDQEKSTPTIRPRSRGNESGHGDDDQPVAFTTAIAETSQSAVIQGQTLACWSITFGMEQIFIGIQLPFDDATFDEDMAASAAWAVRHRKSHKTQKRVMDRSWQR